VLSSEVNVFLLNLFCFFFSLMWYRQTSPALNSIYDIKHKLIGKSNTARDSNRIDYPPQLHIRCYTLQRNTTIKSYVYWDELNAP